MLYSAGLPPEEKKKTKYARPLVAALVSDLLYLEKGFRKTMNDQNISWARSCIES
jgi:hypothetical protein